MDENNGLSITPKIDVYDYLSERLEKQILYFEEYIDRSYFPFSGGVNDDAFELYEDLIQINQIRGDIRILLDDPYSSVDTIFNLSSKHQDLMPSAFLKAENLLCGLEGLIMSGEFREDEKTLLTLYDVTSRLYVQLMPDMEDEELFKFVMGDNSNFDRGYVVDSMPRFELDFSGPYSQILELVINFEEECKSEEDVLDSRWDFNYYVKNIERILSDFNRDKLRINGNIQLSSGVYQERFHQRRKNLRLQIKDALEEPNFDLTEKEIDVKRQIEDLYRSIF